MGQKVNLNSIKLRLENQPIVEYSIVNFKIVNYLSYYLAKKGFIVSHLSLVSEDSKHKALLVIKGVFSKNFIIFKKQYRGRLLKKQKYCTMEIKELRSKLGFKNLKIRLVSEDHKITGKYYNLVFKRMQPYTLPFFRFQNSFYDLLRIGSLSLVKKVRPLAFLSTIGYLFKRAPKRSQKRFLFFLRSFWLSLIIINKQLDGPLVGVKMQISGRLNGKARASIFKLNAGGVSVQKISSDVEYNSLSVNTLDGTFGIKLWLSFKSK